MREEENKRATSEITDSATNDKFVPGHEFDGIRELANEPPFWLSAIFVITVVFSYYYLAKYHIFDAGDLQEEAYKKEMAKYVEDEEEIPDTGTEGNAETKILKPFSDEENLNLGKELFKTNCTVCHLSKGQGLVGPNLTDNYWIHGGSYEDIVNIIIEGVPSKGMISWETQLNKTQIQQVSSYVYSLVGTDPPNPKPPEGELYDPGSKE